MKAMLSQSEPILESKTVRAIAIPIIGDSGCKMSKMY